MKSTEHKSECCNGRTYKKNGMLICKLCGSLCEAKPKHKKNKALGGQRLNFDIAEEIRNHPDNKGLTQSELGEKYGVSREAINKILNYLTYKK
jgi:predicted DNA-binding protein (UPF0251 family)